MKLDMKGGVGKKVREERVGKVVLLRGLRSGCCSSDRKRGICERKLDRELDNEASPAILNVSVSSPIPRGVLLPFQPPQPPQPLQ